MITYRKYVNLILFILIFFATFRLEPNPFETDVLQVNTSDQLYMKITDEAEKEEYNEPPENAYIDRVWKKTPGRNGRKVNIEASYEKMRKSGQFDEKLLVFDEIEPEIGLDDLPAAPIYRGHPDKQMVTFMINVSWGAEYIPAILQVLQDQHVQVNFFIEGKWARENPDLVKLIADKGHLIGNHAYDHPDMARISTAKMEEQISRTNEILTAILGETPQYFTPPSGSFNDQVVQVAADLNMETILWTTDTIDWKNPSVSVMINRVKNKVHPGAIILMPPTEVIADGLEDLIISLKDKGYRIGKLDRLLSSGR